MFVARSATTLRSGAALVVRRGSCVRQVHGSRGAKKAAQAGGFDVVNADVGKLGTSAFHYLNFALLGLAPVALVAGPAFIKTPMEAVLAVAFPVHAHVSMNYVISDYVPRAVQQPARLALVGVTGVVTLGLLRLALGGPGLVSTLGALWTKPKKEEEEAKK